MRPLDLQAMALGATFSKGKFGGFYAASVAYGNPAMPNNIVRGMMLFAQPMYASATLVAAPLARNGLTTQQGASAFALDWVAGGTFTTDAVSVRAGYAGSRGLYANVIEDRLGLFASGMLGGGDTSGGLIGFFRGGLDRTNLNKLVKGGGLASVFIRDLPYGAAPTEEAAADQGLLSDVGRLRTGHVEWANIGHVIDVGTTLSIKPISSLYDASGAVHSRDFVVGRDEEDAPEGFMWSLKAGVVNIPGNAVLGLEDGQYFSGRVDFGGAGELDGAQGNVSGALLINDPELLALYPYSVNSVTVRIQGGGKF